MTLERVTERIQEAKDKANKLDGRRFNVRSKRKMNWEMRDIQMALKNVKRKNPPGLIRGLYTKAELEEYRKMDEEVNSSKLVLNKKEQDSKTKNVVKSSC